MNTSHKTTPELTEINGTQYVWHKNTWQEYDQYRIKHRRKRFVRSVKRTVAGPIAGLLLAVLAFQVFHTPLLACVGLGMVFAIAGLRLRFRYVKYLYAGLVFVLYVYLLLQVIS